MGRRKGNSEWEEEKGIVIGKKKREEGKVRRE